ncbi:MAG: hypothetical protein LBM16_01800 [Clostridiales bacterium]|jgi:hypothetical protein|nr:hypothetical protein [Clostridiales bacterium]
MITNHWKNLKRDIEFNISQHTFPSEYYLGFSTTAPAEDGTGVSEPTQLSYARKPIGTWEAQTEPGVAKNLNSIVFNETTGAWGTLTHLVIFDALTEGNLLMSCELAIPRIINQENMTLTAPIRSITIAQEGGESEVQTTL